VKRPQWITLGIAACLAAAIFAFCPIAPDKKTSSRQPAAPPGSGFSTDTILLLAKKQLTAEQGTRIAELENSISRGAVKDQQLAVYHQLAHFWGDSMEMFAPYAWYEAEAARLENSEKSLTFAAHLFLNSLQEGHDDPRAVRWKALQAKDLFERSLRINPDDDSSKVGLGACYLFGNISATPMEGISKIREVVEKDSTNVYAQMMLAKGSLISGQLDKAIIRLNTVYRLQPDNVEAILLLADVNEGMGDKEEAADWYRKSLLYINRPDARAEIEKRIADLTK
jgi:tetratricopeptide (TPR) repeat protein